MLEPFCACAPHREASSCSASPVTSDNLSEIASTAVALPPLSSALQRRGFSLHLTHEINRVYFYGSDVSQIRSLKIHDGQINKKAVLVLLGEFMNTDKALHYKTLQFCTLLHNHNLGWNGAERTQLH
jgi:hypothetical protein